VINQYSLFFSGVGKAWITSLTATSVEINTSSHYQVFGKLPHYLIDFFKSNIFNGF